MLCCFIFKSCLCVVHICRTCIDLTGDFTFKSIAQNDGHCSLSLECIKIQSILTLVLLNNWSGYNLKVRIMRAKVISIALRMFEIYCLFIFVNGLDTGSAGGGDDTSGSSSLSAQ